MSYAGYEETPIKIGMVVRPKPLFREQDEMLVQWVGQNGNQVILAGWCSKKLTVDGRDNPNPGYGTYACFDYGKSFQVVSP